MNETMKVHGYLIDALRRELVGPDPGPPAVQWHGPGSSLNGEEILRPQDRPKMRYGAGILFPNGMTYSGLLDELADRPDDITAESSDADEADARADEGETEADDDTPNLNSFVPSTMGISFLADTRDGLNVEVRWATYVPQPLPGWVGTDSQDEQFWFRTPHTATVPVEPGGELPTTQCEVLLADGAGPVLAVVDRPWRGSQRLITLTLINKRQEARGDDTDCFFQCGLVIRPHGGSSICPYPSRSDADLDEEERSLKLLYRHRPTYAVGHGCAADWRTEGVQVTEVRTEIMPVFTQHPILPRDQLEGVNLSMLGLSRSTDAEVLVSCEKLASDYETWIRRQQTEPTISSLSPELKATAQTHLARCGESLERIRRGIQVLRNDSVAMKAFRWMNLAMVQQRSHYGLSADKEKRRGWTQGPDGLTPERPFMHPEYPYSVAWRPFQLAFILMNLQGLADDSVAGIAERQLVDVIWFPTGGGKTEAYLGLAGWLMLYRRLCCPTNSGTAVLMRYTLRLLTAQQFQRASSLICALELLRRENSRDLGEEPITIGLWLGSGMTPNKDEDAIARLEELNRGEAQNPFVVLSCPWCGVEMGPRQVGATTRVIGYHKLRDPRPTVALACEDPNCPFRTSGLPLEVIDERIYRRPPTMLIGTVDKFAMLAWTPEARRIFGIDVGNVDPPDLIIQDELHLISGPLGSMVGHYETLIDELCTKQERGTRVGPKIVASTATIARADEQVEALYARRARLFPSQALQAGDSFFAEERSDIPGRTYVGVLAAGLSSHIVAQIRTTAALLQAPSNLRGIVDPKALDPYWSLVAYFNSLRELGRASTLIQADIREYLNWIWQRSGVSGTRGETVDRRRFINHAVELTSRVPSAEIPEVLERLFTSLPDPATVDVCFATNMIQVGLDVPRLSLMTIVGQPKGASEYIQASSRVGRDVGKPGLVVTNYNPFKPRDRSHFETFRQYHDAIYRHVEPTSVTPFSLPVLERAVHALAVALIRCTEPSLRERPVGELPLRLQDRVREVVLRRVERVAKHECERAEVVLAKFFDDWRRKQPERYGDFSPTPADSRPLMVPAGRIWGDSEDPIPKPTPSSMRNVDAESEARVIHAYLDEGSVFDG